MIGIRMHLEEETVGTERPGCPGHGRHELAVTARLAAGGTGALYGMRAVHDDRRSDTEHVGNVAEIDHQVVVAVHIATFGKPNLTGTGLHRLFIRVSHIFTRKELRFLDIDRTSRTGRSDQQIGLAAKECRNLDHIDDFADRSGLTGFVNCLLYTSDAADE